MIYHCVVQPIRNSPHVANGHFNVANRSVSKYFKNAISIIILSFFHLNSHFPDKNLGETNKCDVFCEFKILFSTY